MEILAELYINDETINYLNENLTESEQEEIKSSISFVFNSIRYLRKIGVREDIIENILKDDYSIFITGEETIKNYVENIGQDIFVKTINEQ